MTRSVTSDISHVVIKTFEMDLTNPAKPTYFTLTNVMSSPTAVSACLPSVFVVHVGSPTVSTRDSLVVFGDTHLAWQTRPFYGRRMFQVISKDFY